MDYDWSWLKAFNIANSENIIWKGLFTEYLQSEDANALDGSVLKSHQMNFAAQSC